MFNSAWIHNLHSEANKDEIASHIMSLVSHITKASPDDSWSLFHHNYRNIELLRLRQEVDIVNKLTAKNDTNALLLATYFSARSLVNLYPGDKFAAGDRDDYFTDILRLAADSFWQYGHLQFNILAKSLYDLADEIVVKGYNNVAVLELPLGNIIPVAVLCKIFDLKNVKYKTISLSTPRNDKSKYGNTYKKVISKTITSLNNKYDLILHIDEVITGSNFDNILKEIRKAAKAIAKDVFSMAFVAPPHKPLTLHHLNIRKSLQKKLLSGSTSRISKNLSWIQMEKLPWMDMDDGWPIVYECPVIWGEEDFVCGVRKVNFIFNMIEHYKLLSKNLSCDDHLVLKLRKLWTRDVSGRIIITPHQLVKDVFSKIHNCINWDMIFEEAKKCYGDDYNGKKHEMSQSQAQKRLIWIAEQVKIQANNGILKGDAANEGDLLMNALHALDGSSFPHEFKAFDRDRSYCEYTLPYNDLIRTFHTKLIENTFKQVVLEPF